jgi:uncharacterized membrane protein HdeD (DUF308 family)
MSESIAPAPVQALSRSRGWLIFSGVLSIFVGFIAIGSPLLFSVVIAQLLGIFAIVSGVVSLILAIFGKHQGHRVLEGVLAVIRIVAGIVLLSCVGSAIAVITLILAIFFVIEGVHSVIGAIQMRAHKGWVWTLISGLAAILLGAMVWARWPSDSNAVLGLLYGINSIFWGMSVLALGFGAPKQAAA